MYVYRSARAAKRSTAGAGGTATVSECRAAEMEARRAAASVFCGSVVAAAAAVPKTPAATLESLLISTPAIEFSVISTATGAGCDWSTEALSSGEDITTFEDIALIPSRAGMLADECGNGAFFFCFGFFSFFSPVGSFAILLFPLPVLAEGMAAAAAAGAGAGLNVFFGGGGVC